MTTVGIIKDWDWPDLRRQTPGGTGEWNGVRFVVDGTADCDLVVVLNNRMRVATQARCPAENVWALMQEPHHPGFNDWMVEKHGAFGRFFTHHPPSDHPRYIRSQPALPWHVNRTFDQLTTEKVPGKPHAVSWVVGNARDLPGHALRWRFLEALQEGSVDIALFGRAVAPIEDKWDGLAPYRYSLAVENTSKPDYWTEKIADCFLAWTVPIYFGCTNLEDYFPAEAFIRLDIGDPQNAVERLSAILVADHWENRLEALAEARRRVLHEYQIFPWLTRMIERYGLSSNPGEPVTIPAYRRSVRATLLHWGYKLKRKVNRY
jgi:hypothetical protein